MYQWNAYWWKRIRLILRLCLTEVKEKSTRLYGEVCEYVATLKGVSAEAFAQITTQNFERLFKIRVEINAQF